MYAHIKATFLLYFVGIHGYTIYIAILIVWMSIVVNRSAFPIRSPWEAPKTLHFWYFPLEIPIKNNQIPLYDNFPDCRHPSTPLWSGEEETVHQPLANHCRLSWQEGRGGGVTGGEGESQERRGTRGIISNQLCDGQKRNVILECAWNFLDNIGEWKNWDGQRKYCQRQNVSYPWYPHSPESHQLSRLNMTHSLMYSLLEGLVTLKRLKSGTNSQKGKGGVPIWETFPNNLIF